MLSADDLLAGSSLTRNLEIPQRLLGDQQMEDRQVCIRPLSVQDLRLIARAARDNDDLTSALMVQQALIEPKLSVQQIARMPAGLMQYLLQQVNRFSGIGVNEQELADAMDDPLTQASCALSQAFGWTPDQISELTLGQIMVHLQMLRERPELNPEPGDLAVKAFR